MVKINNSQLTLSDYTSIILINMEKEFVLSDYLGESPDYFNGLKEGVTVWSI